MSHPRLLAPVAALGLSLLALDARAADIAPAPAHLVQGSLNIYRRFPAEARDRMVGFYNQVIGLQPMGPINLGGGQQIILFRLGTGQVKLAAGLKAGRQYHVGGATEATGIRLFTFYFPDQAALLARLAAFGLPAPSFAPRGDGAMAALVKDPAGFPLELVILRNADPAAYARADVGIAVTDLAASSGFYHGFARLEALPPVKDAVLGLTLHPFRNGQTVVNLWQVPRGLPADTGSAGIQYVVDNVDAVAALADQRGITVEEPLGGVPGFNVRTVWLNDPDGVTNYFYQLVGPSMAPAR